MIFMCVLGLFFGLLIGMRAGGAPEPVVEPTAKTADAASCAGGDVQEKYEELLAEIRRLKLQPDSGETDCGPQQTSPVLPSLVFMTSHGQCYHTSKLCRALRSGNGHRGLRPCGICCRP